MAFHRPIPASKQRSGIAGGIGALVEAEKLMQIAFVMPAAVLVGWGLGWWLGNALHQKWIEIVGIVFGCIAGLVYVVKLAVLAEKNTSMGDKGQDESGKGITGPQP